MIDSGIKEDDVASYKLLRYVWATKFPALKVREHMNVDSKDTTSNALRRLIRREITRNAEERERIRGLRMLRREALTLERMFYWQARQRATQRPLEIATGIWDGARRVTSFLSLRKTLATSVTRLS